MWWRLCCIGRSRVKTSVVFKDYITKALSRYVENGKEGMPARVINLPALEKG